MAVSMPESLFSRNHAYAGPVVCIVRARQQHMSEPSVTGSASLLLHESHMRILHMKLCSWRGSLGALPTFTAAKDVRAVLPELISI